MPSTKLNWRLPQLANRVIDLDQFGSHFRQWPFMATPGSAWLSEFACIILPTHVDNKPPYLDK